MAIDIYEGGILRLSVSTDAFLELEAAQEEMTRRAGRRVDPFGTSSVEPQHAIIWLGGLRRLLPNLKRDPRARRACEDLIGLLEDVIQRRKTIMVEGE